MSSQSGTDIHMLLYTNYVPNENLLCSPGRSTQGPVVISTGRGSQRGGDLNGEEISTGRRSQQEVSVQLLHFAAQQKLATT